MSTMHVDAHFVIANNRRSNLSVCNSIIGDIVFIVDEPPMNRHYFLSRLVNWMINRAKEQKGEDRRRARFDRVELEERI